MIKTGSRRVWRRNLRCGWSTVCRRVRNLRNGWDVSTPLFIVEVPIVSVPVRNKRVLVLFGIILVTRFFILRLKRVVTSKATRKSHRNLYVLWEGWARSPPPKQAKRVLRTYEIKQGCTAIGSSTLHPSQQMVDAGRMKSPENPVAQRYEIG